MLAVGDIFRPEVGLAAENVPGLFRGQNIGHGFEGIDAAERDVAADGQGLVGRVPLIIVDVAVGGGGHDDVVPALGRGDAAFGAAPGHDGRPRGQPAFEDLVPADETLAHGVKDLLHPLDEIALELALVLQPLGFQAGLAGGAALPFGLVGLVAPDVDEWAGEESGDLDENILQELEGLLLARAEDVGDGPVAARLDRERPARAGELGVGGQGRRGVAGHLDLGHDGDMARRGVSDDLADLVLGVEPAVGRGLAGLLGLAGVPVLVLPVDPPGPDLGQPGIFLDLDAPALVVRQVPMEGVQLVRGQDVDPAQDELLGEEVAGAVEKGPPPGESRLVLDADARDRPRRRRPGRAFDRWGQELAEGLDTVEDSRRHGAADENPVGGDVEKVAFVPQPGREILEPEDDRAGRHGDLPGELGRNIDADGISGRAAEHVFEGGSHGQELDLALLDGDARGRSEGESPGPGLEAQGGGYDRWPCSPSSGRRGGAARRCHREANGRHRDKGRNLRTVSHVGPPDESVRRMISASRTESQGAGRVLTVPSPAVYDSPIR